MAKRKNRKVENVEIPDSLGIKIEGETLAVLELTNDEHLDALQIMIDQARLINADREGRGGEPARINYVAAVVALLLSADDEDVIDMFAELYVELKERSLPVAPFMADEPPVVDDEEFSQEDLLRLAAYWNAFIDCRPGWMDDRCHNISAEEVGEMVILLHMSLAQGEGFPR